jgi:hypothetical protein
MNVKAAHDLKRAGIESAIADGAIPTEQGPRNSVLPVYVRDLREASGSGES